MIRLALSVFATVALMAGTFLATEAGLRVVISFPVSADFTGIHCTVHAKNETYFDCGIDYAYPPPKYIDRATNEPILTPEVEK